MAVKNMSRSGEINGNKFRLLLPVSFIVLVIMIAAVAVIYFWGFSGIQGMSALKTIMIIAIVMVFLAAAALFISIRLTFKPIDHIVGYAKIISEGELNVSDIIIEDKSSLGILAKAFNDMKSNLLFFVEQTKNNVLVISEFVEKLSRSVDTNYKGSEQIAKTIEDVAFKAQEQLNLVKSTNENIEGIYKSLDNILMYIEEAGSTAEKTSEITWDGIESLGKYNLQMNAISDSINNTYEFIGKLRESIKEIYGIIEFITGISEQLRLLALNASIEAARVGDAGKGFAVVANETTKLSDAAREGIGKINNIVSSVMENSSIVENAIESCKVNFDKSEQMLESIIDILKKINEGSAVISSKVGVINSEAAHINDAVKGTAALSQELFNSSNIVSSNTQEVASVVEEELAGLHEINSSTSILSSMLSRIEKLTESFNTSVKPVDEKPNKHLRIAVICPYSTKFWDPVKQGVMYAKKELAQKNTTVDWFGFEDENLQNFKNAFEKCIRDGYDGIAVTGFYKELVPLVNKASEMGIVVATFNGDFDGDTKRLCFVGQESYRAGKLAGEIMAKELKGEGRVAILTGFFNIGDHELRRNGFKETLLRSKGIVVAAEVETHNKDQEAYQKLKEILAMEGNINGVYITAGASGGAARAIEEAGLAGRIKFVCFDFTDEIIGNIKKGIITASIGQDPFSQGHNPVIYIYNYIVANQKPPQEKMWTRMDIVNSSNVNSILV